MGSDPQFAKYPNLGLAQSIFSISTNPGAVKSIQNAIQEHKMAPLYRHLAHPTEGILNSPAEGSLQTPGTKPLARRESIISSNLLPARRSALTNVLPWHASLYEELKADNEKELEAIQKEEEAAEENAGETEIQAARGKRAEFWARVGDKVAITVGFRSNTFLTRLVIG
jgi:26S proteasome regulatory subunit N7